MSETEFSEGASAADAEAKEPQHPEAAPVTDDEVAADIESPAEAGDQVAALAPEEAGAAEPASGSGEPPQAQLDELEDQAVPAPLDEIPGVPAEEATLNDAEADPEPEPEVSLVPDRAFEEPPEQAVEAEPTADKAGEAEPEGDGRARSRFDGPGDWYVIHTYAGYENKVKANLQSRIGSMQMEDKIFEVVIPMEDVMEIKSGKKQVVQKKVFPGYLMVKMVYDNDSWYVVRNTPGVTGFVSSGTGTKPTPLSRREVEKILAVKQETQVKPQYRLEWEEGDVVRIIAGPFADFTGTIAEINVEQSKLKVMVNIFDRETPVELAFDQVAKA